MSCSWSQTLKWWLDCIRHFLDYSPRIDKALLGVFFFAIWRGLQQLLPLLFGGADFHYRFFNRWVSSGESPHTTKQIALFKQIHSQASPRRGWNYVWTTTRNFPAWPKSSCQLLSVNRTEWAISSVHLFHLPPAANTAESPHPNPKSALVHGPRGMLRSSRPSSAEGGGRCTSSPRRWGPPRRQLREELRARSECRR